MSSESASCFYTILGINPSASEDVIRKAYKRRALEWYPDKNLNNPDAEYLFKVLRKAYETLSSRNKFIGFDNRYHIINVVEDSFVIDSIDDYNCSSPELSDHLDPSSVVNSIAIGVTK